MADGKFEHLGCLLLVWRKHSGLVSTPWPVARHVRPDISPCPARRVCECSRAMVLQDKEWPDVMNLVEGKGEREWRPL